MVISRIFLFTMLFGISLGSPVDSRILGECPHDWDHAGDICYKFDHDDEGFFGGLRACKKKEEHHINMNQHFNEDESLLLTVGKILNFYKDGYYPHHYFHHTIRINAVAVNGKWFDIHDVSSSHIELEEIPGMITQAQEITESDFEFLGIGSLYNQSENGNGLIFNPNEGNGTFKISNIDFDFPYVCTHKKASRPGNACPGLVAECNDRGTCFYGICECLDGYSSATNCGPLPGTTTTTTTAAPLPTFPPFPPVPTTPPTTPTTTTV